MCIIKIRGSHPSTDATDSGRSPKLELSESVVSKRVIETIVFILADFLIFNLTPAINCSNIIDTKQ